MTVESGRNQKLRCSRGRIIRTLTGSKAMKVVVSAKVVASEKLRPYGPKADKQPVHEVREVALS